jgi:hypothetical protein
MTEAKTKSATLQWILLVKKRNSDPRRVPPGKESLTWITNTVTLLYGERDAMLVDTFLPTMIYITHAHPDHFCGLKLLLDRFPGARAVAPPQVVKAMHATIAPDVVKNT